MVEIKQDSNIKLSQTKRTVEWLINHTEVRVFDPVTFSGYQRKVDLKHRAKLVNYLLKNFFLPTSIICATTGKNDMNNKLKIVDGQHRIEALRYISQEHEKRYNDIKNKEISVIIMENVSEEVEINTFITINKTSKKVDTSLALVLKNKLSNSRQNDSNSLLMPKMDYLSVELAEKINNSDSYPLWYNKISFEGNPQNTFQLISLNAFVKSTRRLLKIIEKKNILQIMWNNSEDVEFCLQNVFEIFNVLWLAIYEKWPQLFEENLEKRRIIQGAIGYSSIIKMVCLKLEENNSIKTLQDFLEFIKLCIYKIEVEYTIWLPGNEYSKYTSESGYAIIANDLIKHCSQG